MLTAMLLAVTAPAGNPANNVSPRTSDDQVICQRETPTGSVITTRKLCLTKAEWNGLEEDYKAGGRKLVDERLRARTGA
jgi:hypothetical protein